MANHINMEQYSNNFLIDRLYIELGNHQNSGKKLLLDKPEISSANKKTFIRNFKEICNKLNRKVNEVQDYFTKELATTISLNQDGVLIITGVYKQSGIIKILSTYIKNYVTCKECNSCDTEIIKESRITFLKCNKCLSKKAFVN